MLEGGVQVSDTCLIYFLGFIVLKMSILFPQTAQSLGIFGSCMSNRTDINTKTLRVKLILVTLAKETLSKLKAKGRISLWSHCIIVTFQK